jgi:hypothetical protein
MTGGTEAARGTRKAEKFKDGLKKRGGVNTQRHAGPGRPSKTRPTGTKDRNFKSEVPTMTQIPVMQIRHNEKDEWFVAAKWPDGRTEDVMGFATESDANAWIANELQAWLDQKRQAPHA